MKRFLLICLAILMAAPAYAVEPDEVLDDPVLEARARDISANLRCVVCQNQDIDQSNAGIAKDLRVLIRERLLAGDTNDEVVQFVVARYGDFVLLRPPFKQETYILWFGPFIFLGIGLLLGGFYFRNLRKQAKEKSA